MRLRRIQADAIDDSTGEAGIDRRLRRAGRGLGPFSGGQLTIIIVTFAVLLLFPVGAWALSFTNVAITDPGGVNRAKVNAAGQLSTAATVSGSVTATQAYPTAATYHNNDQYANTCGGGTCPILAKPPAGKALEITTIQVDSYRDSAGFGGVAEYVQLLRSSDGTCNRSSFDFTYGLVEPAGVGSQTLTYNLPAGLPVQAGKALCLLSGSSTLQVGFSAYGLIVAPTAVPT